MQQYSVPGGQEGLAVPVPRSRTRSIFGAVWAALTVVLLLVVAAVPAGATTVTFIRHGESAGNASGYIDTKVPGPGLTALGQTEAAGVQAKLIAQGIDPTKFDNLYTSTMIRTQQTAAPLATALGKTPVIIGTFDPSVPQQSGAGIQEIFAGIFEGVSQEEGLGRIGYGFIPIAWTLGLRFVRIPGSENGNEFDARVDAAIAQMEADGDTDGNGEINVAAFSHGATIMFWSLMNVDNPNLTLFLTNPLNNTDVVVVESNGEGGWTMKSWAGIETPEANYPTQMFVNVRDLIVAPQTAIYNLRLPVFALDGEAIVQTAAARCQRRRRGNGQVRYRFRHRYGRRDSRPHSGKPSGAVDLVDRRGRAHNSDGNFT